MLSIIICSRHKILDSIFVKNIMDSVGVEVELITIDNSENKYSIFKAYNLGVQRSKYNNLCFLHEDVCFHSDDWGQKILQHLQIPDMGICGVAGRDFVSRVPAAWNKKL